jgi:hypothetical protein
VANVTGTPNAARLILIKVATCVFVLAADGAGDEVLREHRSRGSPGPAARREAGSSSNDVPTLLFM